MLNSITVNLTSYHCTSCGMVYAVPDYMTKFECPSCAYRQRASLRESYDRSLASRSSLERKAAALKGVIKKQKKIIDTLLGP